jgi:hypothetical protein
VTCELLTKVLDAHGDGRITTMRASSTQRLSLAGRCGPCGAGPISSPRSRYRWMHTASTSRWRRFLGAVDVPCSTSTLSGWLSEPKRGGSSSSATIHDQALHRSTCRPPDPIQIAHFGSAANRTYITQPYSLTYPGIGIHEIEPWQEADQTWRRLAVHFPPGNANHNPDQIFNN